MKCQGINIATARIHGLNRPPYYFDHKCFYAWSIEFSDSSTLFFNNIPFIKVGDTKEQGEIYCNQLKSNFKNAHIYEGDKVAIIFDKDGAVLAIGHTSDDVWIDVRDNFVKKAFKDLNIVVTALKVY